MSRLFVKEPDYVGQRHGSRTFVTVHLRPEQHGGRSSPVRKVSELPTLCAEAFRYGPHTFAEVRRNRAPIRRVSEPAVVQVRYSNFIE